ncbi:unnamed protein product [Prunus armeniaca]
MAQCRSPPPSAAVLRPLFQLQTKVDEILVNLHADPGLRTRIADYSPNIRDEIRRAYLQKGPCQPRMGGDAFTGVGFNNWKKAKERFNLHVGLVGSVHNQAKEVAYNLMHHTLKQ